MNRRADFDQDQLREPPWSQEAEQAVLGSLLLDNRAFDRISDLQLEQRFYDHRHRILFGAIAARLLANKAVDVITMASDLPAVPGGESVGGMAYLHALTESVPSSASVRRYAEVVREKALQRDLIAAADEALALAWSAGDAAGKLDLMAAMLDRVQRPAGQREERRFGDVVAERMDHYSDLASGAAEPGWPTGLPRLDKALGGGLKAGRLVVLAARPTVGKTSLAEHIASAMAKAGHSVAMLSQEMTVGELVDRGMANTARVGLDRISTGELEPEDWSRLSEAAEETANLPFWIDDQAPLTLLDIRGKARRMRHKHGIKLLIVDYLQLVASAGGNDRRHHQIEQISRGLKVLAKELDITVLLLSQLNRASEQRPEPELTDLKESGAIEEDADTVILLHPWCKSGTETVLLAKVAKNRGGRRGRLALEFDGRHQRWSESNADVAPRAGRA